MRVRFECFGLSLLLETNSFPSPRITNESDPDSIESRDTSPEQPSPKCCSTPAYDLTFTVGMARMCHWALEAPHPPHEPRIAGLQQELLKLVATVMYHPPFHCGLHVSFTNKNDTSTAREIAVGMSGMPFAGPSNPASGVHHRWSDDVDFLSMGLLSWRNFPHQSILDRLGKTTRQKRRLRTICSL
jgi:hypothetical protein